LCSPTHFAKDAKWMGHPELRMIYACFAKDAKWMGHPVWWRSEKEKVNTVR